MQAIGLRIRVIVANQLPLREKNAMLHLFSVRQEVLQYGRDHYHPNSGETSTLLFDLFKAYSEDLHMPDKLAEYIRESREKLFKTARAEELARLLPPETLKELARLLQAQDQSGEAETADDRPRE